MNAGSTLRFKIIIFSLTSATVAFAFIHSLMPATQSAEESEAVLDVFTYVFGFFGIDAEFTDHIVRKLAHFTEYSVLGAFLLSCAYSFNRFKPYKFLPHTLGCGLLVSLIDETIQLNVEGRSGQVTDIWIDFCGVIFGTAVMILTFFVYRKIRKISRF